jgi:hypothetical protein
MAGWGRGSALMPASGLDETTQADWSGGMCRAVARHLIPGDAAYDMRDALLDDDGNVYQRGPTRKLTTDQLTNRTLLAVWEGSFTPGRRTIGIGATGDIGVVGPGDTAWRKTSGALFASTGGIAAQVGELMFLPGGFGIIMYAGSLLTASYTTGTATFTRASKTVTGAGTRWTTGLDVGMLMRPQGSTFWGVVASVDSDTQVTLVDAWQDATLAGIYTANPYATAPFTPLTGVEQYAGVAQVANRLLWADGRRVLMSNTIDQDTGQPRLWVHDVDDYHEFPADIVALATLRDTVYVFTKAGIWTISNVGLPIVDAFGNGQHRVQKVSGDVVLRSPGGVAPWRDIVGALRGGRRVRHGRGRRPRADLAVDHAALAGAARGGLHDRRAGRGLPRPPVRLRPRQPVPAAARQHVGRAAGPADEARRSASRRRGRGSSRARPRRSTALAVQDPYGAAKLVGGGFGYLLDLTGLFLGGSLPSTTGGSVDADGTNVGMFVETREYVLDAGALATLRDVALEYESTDGQIYVAAAAGTRSVAGNPPDYTQLASTAPGNFRTQNPRVIAVRREARRASFTFAGSLGGPGPSGWRLRAVRLRTRLRGRRR